MYLHHLVKTTDSSMAVADKRKYFYILCTMSIYLLLSLNVCIYIISLIIKKNISLCPQHINSCVPTLYARTLLLPPPLLQWSLPLRYIDLHLICTRVFRVFCFDVPNYSLMVYNIICRSGFTHSHHFYTQVKYCGHWTRTHVEENTEQHTEEVLEKKFIE